MVGDISTSYKNAATYKLNKKDAFTFGNADYTYEIAKVWEELLIEDDKYIPPAGQNQDIALDSMRPKAYTHTTSTLAQKKAV